MRTTSKPFSASSPPKKLPIAPGFDKYIGRSSIHSLYPKEQQATLQEECKKSFQKEFVIFSPAPKTAIFVDLS